MANAYKGAREAFDLRGEGNERGNFSPFQLARILAAGNGRGAADGQLIGLEVHRGLPSSSRDPIGYGANRRQAAAWVKESSGLVVPRLRPLRYPPHREANQAPVEKGIDVQLALAVVESVVPRACDVAVLFTHDSDLTPTVESIMRLAGASHIETASWRSHRYQTRLKARPGVHHHAISWEVFERIETPVNYAYKGDIS